MNYVLLVLNRVQKEREKKEEKEKSVFFVLFFFFLFFFFFFFFLFFFLSSSFLFFLFSLSSTRPSLLFAFSSLRSVVISLFGLDSNHNCASKTLEESDHQRLSLIKPLHNLVAEVSSGDLDVRAELELVGEDRDKAIVGHVHHLELGASHVRDGHLVGRREEALVLGLVEHAQTSEPARKKKRKEGKKRKKEEKEKKDDEMGFFFVFCFFLWKDHNDSPDLSATVLPGAADGVVEDAAGDPAEHHEASLPQGRALDREGPGELIFLGVGFFVARHP